jgi:tetratricopeptide (TPR) repeat protein
MKNAVFYLILGLSTALFTACRTQEPFLEHGLQALKSHHYDEAIGHFSNALKSDSRNVEALMGRGKAYYFMDNDTLNSDEKAYADFQQVTFITPENATALAWAANAKRKLGQKPMVEHLIEKALQVDPRCAMAYCVQSRMRITEKNYDEALTAIHQAVQLDTADAYIWYCKGLAHNEKDQYAEAVEAFNRAIKLDPLDAKSYENKAFAKQKQKKYFDAIEDYTRAIDLNPTHSANAYAQRGWVKFTMKRYEEAIADYDQSIHLDSSEAWAYFQRGYAKGELKKHQAAIADYDRAIVLKPEYDNALVNRGYEYEQLDQNDRAKKDYATALKINPDNKTARENLKNLRTVYVLDNWVDNSATPTILCGVCGGSGQYGYISIPAIEINQDPIRIPTPCSRCGGKGYIRDPRY